jgi:hypothetical protein
MTTYVNWMKDGAECKNYIIQRYPYLNGNSAFVAKNTEYYFRPGLTWPLRGIRFSAQAIAKDSIFSVAGKMATSDKLREIGPLMALFNSKPFDYMVRFFAGKVGGVQYEVGLISNIPLCPIDQSTEELASLSNGAWSTKRRTDTATLTSHAFHAPALAPGRNPKPTR